MLQEPKTVGKYEIVRKLDSGGMASVSLARQEGMDRYVALKVLHSLPADDPELAARFVNEAKVAGALSHPNIVTMYEHFVAEGRAYIAMEYVPHGSLRPHVQRLTLAQTAGVLEAILAALRHAHARGIIHRDIKPENVLIGEKGVVKLADFGIAKALNSVATQHFQTTAGCTYGTPAYMAPEQALDGQASSASDLYSVGVMAYEMLTRRLPYGRMDRDTPMRMLKGHIDGNFMPADALVPSLDRRLAAWVERMMAREPEDRPADADEAWQALEDIVVDQVGPLWRRDAALDLETDLIPVASTHMSGFITTFDREPATPGGNGDSGPVATLVTGPQPTYTTGSTPLPTPGPVPTSDWMMPASEPAGNGAISANGNGGAQAGNGAMVAAHDAPVVVAPAPQPAAPRPRRRIGRRPLVAAGACVAVAGLGAAGYAAFGTKSIPDFDTGPVAAQMRKQIELQEPVSAVTCAPVSARPGLRSPCTIHLSDTSRTLLAVVTQRPGGGADYHIQLAPR
jgi:serine/threonine protein kinase